jgi:type IV fimbrial biogenesis protein FimT
MIAVVMIGVVLAFAVPSYHQWIENSKVRNAAESILNGIQKARAEAVLKNARVQFTLVGANSAWTVGCVAATANCPATIEQRAMGDGSATSVTVNPAGVNIIFSNLGLRVSGLTQVDVDTTALSATDSRNLTIQVTTNGAARLCDPAFSLPDPKGC